MRNRASIELTVGEAKQALLELEDISRVLKEPLRDIPQGTPGGWVTAGAWVFDTATRTWSLEYTVGRETPMSKVHYLGDFVRGDDGVWRAVITSERRIRY